MSKAQNGQRKDIAIARSLAYLMLGNARDTVLPLSLDSLDDLAVLSFCQDSLHNLLMEPASYRS